MSQCSSKREFDGNLNQKKVARGPHSHSQISKAEQREQITSCVSAIFAVQ